MWTRKAVVYVGLGMTLVLFSPFIDNLQLFLLGTTILGFVAVHSLVNTRPIDVKITRSFDSDQVFENSPVSVDLIIRNKGRSVGFLEVYVKKEVMRYIVELVQATRRDHRVAVGSSPRGSLGLFKLSRALAVLSGRDYVVPDDVKRAVIPVLGHRIILKPEARIRGVNVEEMLSELLMTVEVPAVTVE